MINPTRHSRHWVKVALNPWHTRAKQDDWTHAEQMVSTSTDTMAIRKPGFIPGNALVCDPAGLVGGIRLSGRWIAPPPYHLAGAAICCHFKHSDFAAIGVDRATDPGGRGVYAGSFAWHRCRSGGAWPMVCRCSCRNNTDDTFHLANLSSARCGVIHVSAVAASGHFLSVGRGFAVYFRGGLQRCVA